MRKTIKLEKKMSTKSIDDDKSTTVKLPNDFHPKCWQDDERMDNLFAPFRAKSVNPINWNSKMDFWKNSIRKYCEVKGCASISIGELRDAFQRNGKRPHCLDTVFEQLIADGVIQRRDNFMKAPQHSWSEWAIHKLVKAPFQWSFDRVKERVIPTSIRSDGVNDEQTAHVHIDVAKIHGDALLTQFNKTNECLTVISMEDLLKQQTTTDLNADGVEIALHWLHCQQKASIQKTNIDQKPIILCKLAVDSNCKAEPITPVDISIYSLKKTEKSLIKSVDGIESDIEQTDVQVRQYIRDKKKQLAKSFLRKKHVLEKNLSKTANSLTTVQTLLLQIDETKHNAKIVEAFKMGTKTLKNALDDKNITVDNVDDALADVKEILETNADIQFALSGAQFNDIINDGSVDEESLEAELMDLLEDVGPSEQSQVQLPTNQTEERSDGDETPKSKTNSPSTITNVIDDLLEERLKKLRLENTVNVSIGGGAIATNNTPSITASNQ